MNISSYKGEKVGIVGGGNSAGQAALFLANHAAEIHIILRSNDLGSKMSDYLVQRVKACDNIFVHLSTEVNELIGENYLEACILETKDGKRHETPIGNLFTFIGAKPCTDWLEDLVATDKKGFICTGAAIKKEKLSDCEIYEKRLPQSLETSIPSFFAVGDVRKGSVKRVASAVGEGSMAVSQVHQFLAEIKSGELREYVTKAE
ncbi:MAG: NAD(P)/FAD-dependent oxidoreductase [Spirosomataceae bacterium]|jgi:thioredoxin reductase (NADPH)